MNTEFPSILYGRRRDNVTGNDDFYDLIDKSPSFPVDAETVFRDRLCKSVQWKGNGGEMYPDCFLVWKVDETRILFARMVDAGNDSRHRPHSLRIDAELIDMTLLDNPAAFLSERCIQTEPIDRTEYFNQFFENHWEHLFIATHSYIQYAGIVHRVSEVSEPITIPTENKPVIPQTEPAQPLLPEQSPILSKFSIAKIVIKVLLFFFLVWAIARLFFVRG